jgi:hypothetical protein
MKVKIPVIAYAVLFARPAFAGGIVHVLNAEHTVSQPVLFGKSAIARAIGNPLDRILVDMV